MRHRDDGFVEIEDPEEAAIASGLSGTRAVKSWREKMDELERLGFIRVEPLATNRHRYVLLLHPHAVVLRIRGAEGNHIPPHWWDFYRSRMREVGVVVDGPKIKLVLQHLEESEDG